MHKAMARGGAAQEVRHNIKHIAAVSCQLLPALWHRIPLTTAGRQRR